jgi:hypothetical protein
MKNVLICSIFRNQSENLDLYFEQLCSLSNQIYKEANLYYSLYENDSTDNTKDIINQYLSFNIGISDRFIFTSETLNTNKYGSIWNLERIINLANARNKAVEQGLNKWRDIRFDKIVFIEPDIEYDPKWCSELILARHPAQAGIEPDVYSGWSLRSNKHPKESMYLYDTCATRQTYKDIHWNFETEGKWRNESLIKTHITDIDSSCLHTVYSTFNCFCVYKGEPFYKGIRFGISNDRLKTSDITDGTKYLDADTSNLIESFRKNGYNNVLLNRNCIVRHL